MSRLSPSNDVRLIRDNSVHPGIIQIPIWDKMNLEVFLGGVNLIVGLDLNSFCLQEKGCLVNIAKRFFSLLVMNQRILLDLSSLS